MASQQAEIVHERCENSLHGPEHGAQAQVEQHEEEQRGPEGAGREKSHHFGEGNERQARPLNALRGNKDRVSVIVEIGIERGEKKIITTLRTTACDDNESRKIVRILLSASRQKQLTGPVRNVLLFMYNEAPQALLETVCDRRYKRVPAAVHSSTLCPLNTIHMLLRHIFF